MTTLRRLVPQTLLGRTFLLISLRGQIPLWLSAHVGNPFLLVGFAFEILALARLCDSQPHKERLLMLWALGCSTLYWILDSTPTRLVTITSLAAALIVAHNHPGGQEEASRADRELTVQLKAALGLLEIELLDHFIVTRQRAVSFAENGWL